jgi:hypothetical protein
LSHKPALRADQVGKAMRVQPPCLKHSGQRLGDVFGGGALDLATAEGACRVESMSRPSISVGGYWGLPVPRSLTRAWPTSSKRTSSMMKCTRCPSGTQPRRSGGIRNGVSWSIQTNEAALPTQPRRPLFRGGKSDRLLGEKFGLASGPISG